MRADESASERPRTHGLLDVGEANTIAWWTMGRPGGVPIVVLHGGPGSGTSPAYEALFDLDRFFVVHHDRVIGLVLAPVTLITRSDIDWLYRGAGQRFPEAWSAFSGSPDLSIDVFDLIDAYAERLDHPDRSDRVQAAAAWCRWEDVVASGGVDTTPNPRYDDERFAVGFARTVSHFFRHGAWLDDDELVRNAPHLGDLPGVLVHGRNDASAPIESVRRLAAAWPGASLVEVDGAAHSFSDPTMQTPIREGALRIANQIEAVGG